MMGKPEQLFGTEYKAKCPFCEKGCDKCKDGFTTVKLPSGPGTRMFAKVCKDCGSEAGGCFHKPGWPEPKISPHAICPGCGGRNLKLILVASDENASERES